MNDRDEPGAAPGKLEDVLASIRELVTAETTARLEGSDSVLMLTSEMRVDGGAGGDVPADGPSDAPRAGSAPILDEEAIRSVVNRIVREELQGELGDRIGRNLRKLIRRELAQAVEEQRVQNDGRSDPRPG